MSVMIPSLVEKCKGAMLTTAIGDAMGWPNEPRSKNRIKKPKVVDNFVEWTRSSNSPRWHDEKILPGEYSDDTQLTLSVARSIITGNWESFFARKELPFWLNYQRGGGSALIKAAKSYKNGYLLWQSQYKRDYFNAGGNGATMRILPHVIALAKNSNITKLMTDVIRDTIITHGHPRALLGTTCYAFALDYLLRKNNVLEYGELVNAIIDGQNDWGEFPDSNVFGEWINIAQRQSGYDYIKEWENVCANMIKQLEFIKNSLKKGLILDDTKVLNELGCFGKSNGAGDVAILSAIYLASRYANNPILGIKTAAFSFGADTDTIASITGGLLGMLGGVNWIPIEWRNVQDYNCLIQMAETLLADDPKEIVKKKELELKSKNYKWTETSIGKIRFLELKNVPNGKNGIVTITKWKTMFGQTLYTKTFKVKEVPFESKMIENTEQIYQSKLLYNNRASQIQNNSNISSRTLYRTNMSNQQNDVILKKSKVFVLNQTDIIDLLSSSKFKTNITIGKVLKIIRCLIEGKESISDIAKQFNVEQSFVEQIDKYIMDIE